MAMMIMNNAAAAMTLGELNKNISQVGKQLKKLSSGLRIVGAGDDASGYSISEKMRDKKDNERKRKTSSVDFGAGCRICTVRSPDKRHYARS